MPVVTVRTGIARPDGNEIQLTEFVCDYPECPNIAAHVVGFVKEIGRSIVYCGEHLESLRSRS
jgi:hypothetical protein